MGLSETFLDSDGGFMNNSPRNVPGHTDLEDNEWHMVTLTTMGEGKKGYAVYVDGILGSRRPRGPGMVSLPTISRNASIVAATAPQVGEAMSPSPSGEEVTSNPLAERVASVATKMEHKSASKYAEFEDEEV